MLGSRSPAEAGGSENGWRQSLHALTYTVPLRRTSKGKSSDTGQTVSQRVKGRGGLTAKRSSRDGVELPLAQILVAVAIIQLGECFSQSR
jgi:hypothetical protein